MICLKMYQKQTYWDYKVDVSIVPDSIFQNRTRRIDSQLRNMNQFLKSNVIICATFKKLECKIIFLHPSDFESTKFNFVDSKRADAN